MTKTHCTEIVVFPDSLALAREAAKRFLFLAQQAITERGKFGVALAGGSTPKAMYELLAGPFTDNLDWSRIYVFWGDERFVSPDNADSTYLMVNEALLKKVRIPAINIFAVPTTNCSLEEAATRYSECLINYAGISLPRLDLVLLGMGADGHTASLFPGSATLDSTELVAIERNSPKPPSQRITFTYKLINNAANVLFMVTGADKANTLRRVLAANSNSKQLPSHGVRPTNGKLCWLIDEEAASELD